jgi:hypothetical protein
MHIHRASYYPFTRNINSTSFYFRAICDDYFQEYDERDRIYRFSSPKVLRLLEILRHFKPEKSPDDNQEECQSNSVLEVDGTEISKRVTGNTVSAKGGRDAKVRSTKDDETLQSENANQNHLVPNICESNGSEETVLRGCEKRKERASDEDFVPQDAGSVRSDARQSEVSGEQRGCVNGEIPTCNNIGVLSVDRVEGTLCSDSANEVHIARVVPPFEKRTTSCERELSDTKVTIIPLVNNVLNLNKNCKMSVIDTSFANRNGKVCDKMGNEVSKENEVTATPVTPSKNRADVYSRNKGSRFSRRGHQKEEGSGCLRGGRTVATGRHCRNVQLDDLDALCGIVFVEQRFTAKILYHLLNVSTAMVSSLLYSALVR